MKSRSAKTEKSFTASEQKNQQLLMVLQQNTIINTTLINHLLPKYTFELNR